LLRDGSLELQEMIREQGQDAQRAQIPSFDDRPLLKDAFQDGLPVPSSVLILADPAAGKEFLTMELASAQLAKGAHVLWVSLENFTDSVRNTLSSLDVDVDEYERSGKLTFVDCYSNLLVAKSTERFSADPANLPNLSIVLSLAISEAGKKPRLLVILDSLSPVVERAGIRASTELFRLLVGRTRNLDASLVTTLNRKAFSPIALAAFQEIADSVVELVNKDDATDLLHYFRVRKTMQKGSSSGWIPYQIDNERSLLRKTPLPVDPDPISSRVDAINIGALNGAKIIRGEEFAEIGENPDNISLELTSLPQWILRNSADQRLIWMRADLQQIRTDMIKMVGSNFAKQILYRIGASIARSSYELEKSRITCEADLWKVGDELCRARGWGNIRTYDKIEKKSSLLFRISFHDSPFADGVRDTEPVCDVVRGLITGWLTIFLNRAVVRSEERCCKAMGAEDCEFLVALSGTKNEE
jgi:KaiC/GvpD/RAD55 family RecA-like ATPase/predicted hydrocarbon binding protein